MLNNWIDIISTELQRAGYLVETNPRIPGAQALLYARSPQRTRLGAAKVEDHFLFVDWENAAFGRLDQLKEICRCFSAHANRGFSTPHALRLQIPNLAIVAVSEREFPEEAVRFVRANNLNPWYGGETGQILLVQAFSGQMIAQERPAYSYRPRPGDLPLTHAVEVITKACRRADWEFT